MKHLAIILLSGLLLSLVLYACKDDVKNELYYRDAVLLDIKRCDESYYYLLFRYPDGETVSVSDVNCTIYMGNYQPMVSVPYVKVTNSDETYNLRAYYYNQSSYSRISIKVYLPQNHPIPLFRD